jgi:hypothetical protein
LTNGNGHLDEELKSSSPTPPTRPVEKKLLLSRLATRSLSLISLPFKLGFSLVRSSALILKNLIFSFRWRHSKDPPASEDDVDDADEDMDDDEVSIL